jgi:hypothetical protein
MRSIEEIATAAVRAVQLHPGTRAPQLKVSWPEVIMLAEAGQEAWEKAIDTVAPDGFSMAGHTLEILAV